MTFGRAAAAAFGTAGLLMASARAPGYTVTVPESAVCPGDARGCTIRWSDEDLPLRFAIHDAGGGAFAGEEFVSMVADAFAAWQAVACTNLALEVSTWSGPHMSCGADAYCEGSEFEDGLNRVGMVIDGTFGGGTYGIALWKHDDQSRSVECDIVFDVATVVSAEQLGRWARHEIGHCVGLWHSIEPGAASIMNYSGEAADLGWDDVQGIQFLYPACGSYTCETEADCPELRLPRTEAPFATAPCNHGVCGCEDCDPCTRDLFRTADAACALEPAACVDPSTEPPGCAPAPDAGAPADLGLPGVALPRAYAAGCECAVGRRP